MCLPRKGGASSLCFCTLKWSLQLYRRSDCPQAEGISQCLRARCGCIGEVPRPLRWSASRVFSLQESVLASWWHSVLAYIALPHRFLRCKLGLGWSRSLSLWTDSGKLFRGLIWVNVGPRSIQVLIRRSKEYCAAWLGLPLSQCTVRSLSDQAAQWLLGTWSWPCHYRIT